MTEANGLQNERNENENENEIGTRMADHYIQTNK